VTLGATVCRTATAERRWQRGHYDSQYYVHAGVGIFASTGDSAYGSSYPPPPRASSASGTALVKSSSSRGWAETVWYTNSTEGTGSGCTPTSPSLVPDHDRVHEESDRDLSSGGRSCHRVAVYVTWNASGWNVYGGTSVSSPLVAPSLQRPGRAPQRRVRLGPTRRLLRRDQGRNGSCSPSVLCTAGTDGTAHGWGTPNATAIAGGGGTTEAADRVRSTAVADTVPVDSGPPDTGSGTCSHRSAPGRSAQESCSTCARRSATRLVLLQLALRCVGRHLRQRSCRLLRHDLQLRIRPRSIRSS